MSAIKIYDKKQEIFRSQIGKISKKVFIPNYFIREDLEETTGKKIPIETFEEIIKKWNDDSSMPDVISKLVRGWVNTEFVLESLDD